MTSGICNGGNEFPSVTYKARMMATVVDELGNGGMVLPLCGRKMLIQLEFCSAVLEIPWLYGFKVPEGVDRTNCRSPSYQRISRAVEAEK